MPCLVEYCRQVEGLLRDPCECQAEFGNIAKICEVIVM